ncbi:MAG: hypothetical protein U9O56_08435 [Campylobacterota bacterium]|nr:hypothetical protein [Campylobacterota bacterium]
MNIKKITLASLVGISLLTSANAAQTVKVALGVGSIDFGEASESTTSIKAELSKENSNFHFDLGYHSSELGGLTEFGVGYRYPLNNKIALGLSASIHGLALDEQDTDTTDFAGFAYGLDGSYNITGGHFVDASYKTGTLSDSAGLVDIDMTLTTIAYKYQF